MAEGNGRSSPDKQTIHGTYETKENPDCKEIKSDISKTEISAVGSDSLENVEKVRNIKYVTTPETWNSAGQQGKNAPPKKQKANSTSVSEESTPSVQNDHNADSSQESLDSEHCASPFQSWTKVQSNEGKQSGYETASGDQSAEDRQLPDDDESVVSRKPAREDGKTSVGFLPHILSTSRGDTADTGSASGVSDKSFPALAANSIPDVNRDLTVASVHSAQNNSAGGYKRSTVERHTHSDRGPTVEKSEVNRNDDKSQEEQQKKPAENLETPVHADEATSADTKTPHKDVSKGAIPKRIAENSPQNQNSSESKKSKKKHKSSSEPTNREDLSIPQISDSALTSTQALSKQSNNSTGTRGLTTKQKAHKTKKQLSADTANQSPSASSPARTDKKGTSEERDVKSASTPLPCEPQNSLSTQDEPDTLEDQKRSHHASDTRTNRSSQHGKSTDYTSSNSSSMANVSTPDNKNDSECKSQTDRTVDDNMFPLVENGQRSLDECSEDLRSHQSQLPREKHRNEEQCTSQVVDQMHTTDAALQPTTDRPRLSEPATSMSYSSDFFNTVSVADGPATLQTAASMSAAASFNASTISNQLKPAATNLTTSAQACTVVSSARSAGVETVSTNNTVSSGAHGGLLPEQQYSESASRTGVERENSQIPLQRHRVSSVMPEDGELQLPREREAQRRRKSQMRRSDVTLSPRPSSRARDRPLQVRDHVLLIEIDQSGAEDTTRDRSSNAPPFQVRNHVFLVEGNQGADARDIDLGHGTGQALRELISIYRWGRGIQGQPIRQAARNPTCLNCRERRVNGLLFNCHHWTLCNVCADFLDRCPWCGWLIVYFCRVDV